MLINGRELRAESTLCADVCIVGTGMGAISVAHALISGGCNVLFIEAGPLRSSLRDRPAISVENVGRPFGIKVSRGVEVGGGTEFWHGVCAPLDEVDFIHRPWIPYSGWPISLTDVRPWYRIAQEFLLGKDFDQSGSMALEKFTLQGSDTFDLKTFHHQSKPFRAKSKLLEWCSNHRARCVYNSTALRLSLREGRADTLLVGGGTRTFKVKAHRFVIAAGALETPRLLLNTVGQPEAPSTPVSWWLGRNLLDHPAGYFSQLSLIRPRSGRLRQERRPKSPCHSFSGAVLHPDIQRKYELPNHALFFRTGITRMPVPNRAVMSFLGVRSARDLKLEHATALIRHPYILWRIAHQKFDVWGGSRHRDLFFMTEQLPNPLSQVSLSSGTRDDFGFPVARVDWRLTGEDIKKFGDYQRLLINSMRENTEVSKFRVDSLTQWHDTVASAAHHLGTARMARTIQDGVVDSDLKVFGLDNVWVGDGSVFPTAGSANPSLTICALGHRLGAHLVKRTRLQTSKSQVLSDIVS